MTGWFIFFAAVFLIYLFVRWVNRHVEQLEKALPALGRYLKADAVAVWAHLARPSRQRKVQGPTDDDLEKLLTEPGLPEPPAAQLGREGDMPCIICGAPIPNGRRFCDLHGGN